jgi:hypothetical protein
LASPEEEEEEEEEEEQEVAAGVATSCPSSPLVNVLAVAGWAAAAMT